MVLRRFWAAMLLVIAISACGQPAPAFKEPPVGSFVRQTHLLGRSGAAQSLPGAVVTKDFFAGTNVQPVLGRFFIDADFAPIARTTVVLSNQLWVDRFASSPTAIGQEIQLDDHRSVIVGVAPKGFDFPPGALFWTPKKS